MGLNFFLSSSDLKKSRSLIHFSRSTMPVLGPTKAPTIKIAGNPDPNNYKILQTKQIGRYIVVMLKYPDCKNYEGKKVMVFKSTLEKLKRQKLIDPHFEPDTNKYIHPIARFKPTKLGWEQACLFVKTVLITNYKLK